MKIRLRGQSVRLRLGRSEVARLAGGEAVEETTAFGPADARFGCVLLSDVRAEAIGHTFDAGRLIVRVPARQIGDWANGDAVGFDADLPAGDQSFRLLVEKDFVCIDDESGEPQDDAFPNPSTAC